MSSSVLIQDLFDLAESAATLKASLEAGSMGSQLEAVAKVCEAARHGWSGSNIGYHSTVYWIDLEARPAGAEFSAEWGLMDRWPTHQPVFGVGSRRRSASQRIDIVESDGVTSWSRFTQSGLTHRNKPATVVRVVVGMVVVGEELTAHSAMLPAIFTSRSF